jgi:hypothetical protein
MRDVNVKAVEAICNGLVTVLTGHLPGETDETHENC